VEIVPGIFGIGALIIGKFKNKVEVELIRRAAEEPKGVFDYRMAYEMAKKLILEKREEKKSPEVEAPKSWLP
jgi:hypothetical protein